ncbi:unnamed protein product [Blepharisma stoltei]|uniref:Uncharacterized protein n=1 Tax=Blepharisma stoltei TaxID=1481888 RepID=A0AAU9JFX2_9CILI|nr:unnamed protein product [Blepharisma stoltei]
MYKLVEINPSDNPPPYVPTSCSSCDDNYAPLYILAITLFIDLVLPQLWWLSTELATLQSLRSKLSP